MLVSVAAHRAEGADRRRGSVEGAFTVEQRRRVVDLVGAEVGSRGGEVACTAAEWETHARVAHLLDAERAQDRWQGCQPAASAVVSARPSAETRKMRIRPFLKMNSTSEGWAGE